MVLYESIMIGNNRRYIWAHAVSHASAKGHIVKMNGASTKPRLEIQKTRPCQDMTSAALVRLSSCPT